MIFSLDLTNPWLGDSFISGRANVHFSKLSKIVKKESLFELCSRIEIQSQKESSNGGNISLDGVTACVSEQQFSQVYDYARLMLTSAKDLGIRVVSRLDYSALSNDLKTRRSEPGFEELIYQEIANEKEINLIDWSFGVAEKSELAERAGWDFSC